MTTAEAPVRGEHPTREQWAARQVNLPEPARARLDAIEQAKADARNAADLVRARQAAEADQWRAAFESAVAGALVAAGAEWLVPFRVPDHEVLNLPDFTGNSACHLALFDASACGLWPILVRFVSTGRAWRLDGSAFRVLRPAGNISFNDFATALEWAATYCASPF